MKKNVLLAALLSLPLALKAQSVNLDLSYTAQPIGTASQSAAILYGIYQPNTYTAAYALQLKSDSSGNLLISGTVTASATGTFTMISNTPVAQGAAGTAQWVVDAKGSSVNASGFNFLSATVFTGISGNAEAVLSLTWAASTTAGPVFYDLNCSGATGMNFIISNSSAAIPGFVANAALWGYQPCGQISQIPLEANAGDNPHIHAVVTGLSATTATSGIVSKKRP